MPMRAILGRLMSLNGSVLVFAIIILAVILVTSLSVVSVSVLDRTSSFSTAQSVQSFTVAQSGVEMVLAAVKKQAYNDPLSSVLADLSGWTCTDGVLAGPVLAGSALVSFRTADGETTISSCDTEIFNLGVVKVVGDYDGTARGIETAVAQTVGRIWVDMTANRDFATEYTNDTGFPIDVFITTLDTSGDTSSFLRSITVSISQDSGANWLDFTDAMVMNTAGYHSMGLQIPENALYRFTSDLSAVTSIHSWYELCDGGNCP